MTCSRRWTRGFAISLAASATFSVLTGCSLIESSVTGSQRLGEMPNDGRGILKVADASRNAGDCDEATRLYRIAASKAPDPSKKSQALLGAADCEVDLGNVAAADHDYRAAIALAPNEGLGYLGLGRALLIEQQPAEGVRYLELALKKGADFASVWNDMGVALDQLRRHHDAQLYYRRGLAKYPSDHALRNNLALSLAMSGDFGEAENIMRTLVMEPGATARTRDNLALVLGLAGDDDGAREASRADLDNAALDNNSRYYEQIRRAIAEISSNGKGEEETAAHSSAAPTMSSQSHTVGTAISLPQHRAKSATSAPKHDRKMASASQHHPLPNSHRATVSRRNNNHRPVPAQAKRLSGNHRRSADAQTLASTVR